MAEKSYLGRDTHFEFHEAAFQELKRTGEVRNLVLKEGRIVLKRAQLEAPVSEHGSDGRPPGYLRSQIKMTVGQSLEGVTVTIRTTAKSARGFRYGAYWQRRRPYLRAGTSLTRG